MKISYNPIDALAAVTAQTAANDSIIFDLYAAKLWAKGVRIGADWTDISSKPSSLKNPEAIKFRDINGNEVSYDGSAAKDLTTGTYMAKLPYGFSSFNSKPTWGNTEGTSIASWNDDNGGSIDFRKDNPLKGKMSIKVNGRVYVNDGVNPVLSAEINNGFWGIRTPDGDNNWIRTPDKGLLPYKSGEAGSGNSSLGTDSWYFSKAYIDTIYGSLKGNADTATSTAKLQTARTLWGQNFDGTKDVRGSLSETGHITPGSAGTFDIGSSTLDYRYGYFQWIGAKKGTSLRLAANNSDNQIVLATNGNVGIGITSPTYRLDVQGNVGIAGSIKNLAIGGGIYWDPHVESATDASDAASITVVKEGIAKGTTLILSQMNEATDTIQFKTNIAARLYHNTNVILTSQDTRVSEGKGYINDEEITQVDNATNAINANVWTTPRTFTIGNTSKRVDGSADVSWNLVDIGAAPNEHTHAWNSLTHSSTIKNQAILTDGENKWKLQELNIDSWNNASAFVNTITEEDTDDVINKWNEIVNFLAGIKDDNTLNTLLNSKLSVYELANNTDVSTLINNGIYYRTTTDTSLSHSPFDSNEFALLNITNYQEGDNLIRSRLAFNSQGELKIFDGGATESWHNILTSKNSGIDTDNSIITLNGQTIEVPDSAALSDTYVKKIGDTMSGSLTINTTDFGALIIERDDTNGASIQFRGKSSVYGYIGLNNTNKNKQLLRWGSDATKNPYIILDTSSTYVSTDGIGQINGINITKVNNAKNADYASSAASAIKVVLNQDSISDTEYPLVWSDQSNKDHFIESRLLKSWNDLCYNPKNKRLTVVGSVNTASITATDINATNTITSAGFIHSGITENPEQYVLTANGGYTLFNQISNESVYEFNKTIAVTSEWMDIDEFYGGNQKFLAQSGTYIVQVYVNGTDDEIYENYFSGIMSWYIHQTNSNNSDEIILHRVGHDYSNTIYLRTKESLSPGYTKLQISANQRLNEHTYTFKFKRLC